MVRHRDETVDCGLSIVDSLLIEHLAGVDPEFACNLSDLVVFQRTETPIGLGDGGQQGRNRLAPRTIEPRPKSAADGVSAPAVGKLGPVAGDFGDQYRMFGGDLGVVDEDLLQFVLRSCPGRSCSKLGR
jgi:hypothetical protein